MQVARRLVARFRDRKYSLTWWIRRYLLHPAERDASKNQRPYQEKVLRGHEDRWRLIDGLLSDSHSSCLDVGCNLGDVTVRCADRGLWTVGIDRSAELVDAARIRHGFRPGCAFGVLDITKQSVAKLPNFDVILLLNVHHNWHRAFGDSGTREILREFGQRSRLIVFQGPSRLSRFGSQPPDFIDNDEASVVAHYYSYLTSTFDGQANSVKMIGRSSVVGTREPYRWIFAVRIK